MKLNMKFFKEQGSKGGKKAWADKPEVMKAICSKGGKNRWKNHKKKIDRA